MKITKNDITLSDQKGEQLNLKQLVAFNFPLSQLASSGVGQAGSLTDDVILLQGKEQGYLLLLNGYILFSSSSLYSARE